MNTAFLDAQNLAWKIHHVEAGFSPRSILKTYEAERKQIAENLLNFDAKYAKLFSQRQSSAGVVDSAQQASDGSSCVENEFIKTFKESCEFTSGYGVAYPMNVFNWSSSHPAKSPLFLSYPDQTKLRTGRVLNNATVTRVVDANVIHLEQEVPTNGAYRMFIFAGRPSSSKSVLRDFATASLATTSYLGAFLRDDIDSVSPHDQDLPHSRFFTFCTVFDAKRTEIDIDDMLPAVLARYRTHVYADDVWDKRVPDAEAAAHAKMGLEQGQRAVVVVRPDGYVGAVLRLDDGAETVRALNAYFAAFVDRKLDVAEEQQVMEQVRAQL